MTRPLLEQEFLSFTTRLTDDELRVLIHQARRMVRIGRPKYGGLDLDKDRREWSAEIAEEASDLLFYQACREVALAMRSDEENQ